MIIVENPVKRYNDAVAVGDISFEVRPGELFALLPEWRRQVSLYGNFTAVENLGYFSELAGHRYSDEQLRACLAETGLERQAHDMRLSRYSKGMRQKVGIAITLAKKAKVLLPVPREGGCIARRHHASRPPRADRRRRRSQRVDLQRLYLDALRT